MTETSTNDGSVSVKMKNRLSKFDVVSLREWSLSRSTGYVDSSPDCMSMFWHDEKISINRVGRVISISRVDLHSSSCSRQWIFAWLDKSDKWTVQRSCESTLRSLTNNEELPLSLSICSMPDWSARCRQRWNIIFSAYFNTQSSSWSFSHILSLCIYFLLSIRNKTKQNRGWRLSANVQEISKTNYDLIDVTSTY